jgi:RNase H-fold protein (predicted Holliday junction resolvase)
VLCGTPVKEWVSLMAIQSETSLQFYLGIDPGRDKTGLALVEETGRILAVQVVRTRNFSDALLKFLYDKLQVNNPWGLRKKLRAVVMGDGTSSEEHRQWVGKALPGFPLHIVDEKFSTEEAKELYWQLFPPKGWRSLIPLGLQTPPEPLDGYAAVVQVRRFLEQEEKGTGKELVVKGIK